MDSDVTETSSSAPRYCSTTGEEERTDITRPILHPGVGNIDDLPLRRFDDRADRDVEIRCPAGLAVIVNWSRG